MQLHIGALRNNSSRMFEKLVADTGFDSLNDFNYAPQLSALLNAMDSTDELPKTILSRSFLSFPRHEYFRRILCSKLGTWVENGEYPKDMAYLGKLTEDICYYNAKNYFNL